MIMLPVSERKPFGGSRWLPPQSLASHQPSDETLGNLIGLNPFAHWHSVRLIKVLQESDIVIDPTCDVESSVLAELERMKHEYSTWA